MSWPEVWVLCFLCGFLGVMAVDPFTNLKWLLRDLGDLLDWIRERMAL